MKATEFAVTRQDELARPAEMQPKPTNFSLESVRGSVAPIPNTSPDFEREIADAKEERTGHRAGPLPPP